MHLFSFLTGIGQLLWLDEKKIKENLVLVKKKKSFEIIR